MTSGTVVRWVKAQGDRVAKGEVLVEVETEDARIELESAISGTLTRILCAKNQTASVGDVIAEIAEAGDEDAVGSSPSASSEGGESAAVATDKVVPVLMPKAGQSMEEGVVVKWRVKAGDRIEKGDIIFDVETDKAMVEVEAVDSGHLARIVVPEGEVVAVLVPVAYLAENDADVDEYLSRAGVPVDPSEATAEAEAPVAEVPVPATRGPVVSETGRVKASPAARRLAAERRIDLASISPGSGPQGRIVAADVPERSDAVLGEPGPVRRRMSGMRKAIARNLLTSKQTIPHFYMRLTIDAGPLMAYYRTEKARYPCSVNDVVTLACARVLQEFPPFRTRIDGDELVETAGSNIGLAVGMDDGLVVPVVLHAERMTLQGLAAKSKAIAEAARKGRIEGMGQGIFTITNLGMFGVEEFSAIINPPESAILAVGAVREGVVVRDGALQVGAVLTMTLSCDHRVIDGLVAAKFAGRLKEVLEAPGELVNG